MTLQESHKQNSFALIAQKYPEVAGEWALKAGTPRRPARPGAAAPSTSPRAAPALTREALSRESMKELRERCRAASVPTTGAKDALVGYLLDPAAHRKRASKKRAAEPAPSLFRESERVEARWDRQATFYPGRVTAARAGELYDILYDDGDQEARVPAEFVRSLEEAPKRPRQGEGEGEDRPAVPKTTREPSGARASRATGGDALIAACDVDAAAATAHVAAAREIGDCALVELESYRPSGALGATAYRGGRAALFASVGDFVTEPVDDADRFSGKKKRTVVFAGGVTRPVKVSELAHRPEREGAYGGRGVTLGPRACAAPGCASRCFEVKLHEPGNELIDLLGVEAFVSDVTDARSLAAPGGAVGTLAVPDQVDLDLKCCTSGHVIGAASLDLARVGRLGWGLDLGNLGFTCLY